LKATAIQK